MPWAHECSAFGHTRTDCADFLKSNGNAFNATQSDESDSKDSKDTSNEGVNYLAFIASVKSADSPSECDHPVLVETCDEESDKDSDEESNLQTAYNQLFKECARIKS